MKDFINILGIAAAGVIVYTFWKHIDQKQPFPVAWGSTQTSSNPARVRGIVAIFPGNKAPQRGDQVYASQDNPGNLNTAGGTAPGIASIYSPAWTNQGNPGSYQA